MPKRKYAVTNDGPERLEVEWDGSWFRIRENIRFFLDGHLIGTVPTRAALENGYRLKLEDETVIEAQLLDVNNLRIYYNGQSLEKTGFSKELSIELLIFSALSAAVALIAYLPGNDVYLSAVFFILFLLFGFLVRKPSIPVKIIGVVLPALFLLFLGFADLVRFSSILILPYLFRTVLNLRTVWALRKSP